ncbi:MAG: PIN domain-containing protein [Candidatus Levybacteria bacterium]|nr:PIN domain-containing protein [Candidatus Levybacteria bacterium]MBI2420861.1 PIN domain-containing protein [Candidatus Levybacteria bacterium]
MAKQSKKVFIESGVFFAFVDRANPRYNEAAAYFRYFAQEQYQVFTSYSVIEETYKQIYENISPSLAKDFLRGIMLSNINILYPTEADTKKALKTLINFRGTELTFKSAHSAVLANKNTINQICTFDYLHPLFGITIFYLPV